MRPLSASLLVVIAIVATACGAMERSAAKDPRKCELDPNCAHKPGNFNDCATACVDNIDCMQRCHSVTGQ